MGKFKTYRMSNFGMIVLLGIKYIIGIKIEGKNSELHLIENILNKFNMSDCKSVSIPLPSQIDYEALS